MGERASLYCVEAVWRCGGQSQQTHVRQFLDRGAAISAAKNLAVRRRTVNLYKVEGDPTLGIWERRLLQRYEAEGVEVV